MWSRTLKALCALLVSLVFCGAVYAQDYHHDYRDKHEYRNDSHWNRDQAHWNHERHEREQAYRRNNGYYNNGYNNNGYYGGRYNGPSNSGPYYSGAYNGPYGYGTPYGGYGNGGYGNSGYGGYPGYASNYDPRAYQAGYNNGVNDRMRNKPLNLTTGNWHGVNLQNYQRGYQDGYRSGGGGRGRW